ncbi:hypothetical protein AN958_00302 [Leucoagaricus sp. SymC.cos]|nr:hypothetical protein AN958_00302 [Leucoagaricus sp. SymC.cos]
MRNKFLTLFTSAAFVAARSVPPDTLVHIKSDAMTGTCIGAPQASPGAFVVSTFCGPPPTQWIVGPEASASNPRQQLELSSHGFCLRASGSGVAPLVIDGCSDDDPPQRFSISENGPLVGQDNLCATLPRERRHPIMMFPCKLATVLNNYVGVLFLIPPIGYRFIQRAKGDEALGKESDGIVKSL